MSTDDNGENYWFTMMYFSDVWTLSLIHIYSRSVEEKKGDPFVEKPYVISPEEFGEFEEYEKISLTYYADQVLSLIHICLFLVWMR